MALLTQCTAANRIIETELLTTFTRDAVFVGDTAKAIYGEKATFAYYVYTRKRTMDYRYVGLTQAAAKSEAQRIALAYRRKCWKWIKNDENVLWNYTGKNPPSAYDGERYFVVDAASVSASLSEGSAWEVAVSVDEEISIPYRTDTYIDIAHADAARNKIPTEWTAFEADPTIATNMFTGDLTTVDVDFKYYI